MKKTYFTVAVAMAMTGCATTYQPEAFTGGFTEIQMSENVWRVSFSGNGFTRRNEVEEMAMLRSAELTLLKGYRYFAFLDSRTSIERHSIPQSSTSYTTGNINSFGNFQGTTRTYGGGSMNITKPSANNTVVMFKSNAEANAILYDARTICNSLATKYKAKCP